MKKAKIWLIHVFCKILDIHPVSVKIWAEDPFFCICKKNRVVIELILYD